jgi:hypothetical protein
VSAYAFRIAAYITWWICLGDAFFLLLETTSESLHRYKGREILFSIILPFDNIRQYINMLSLLSQSLLLGYGAWGALAAFGITTSGNGFRVDTGGGLVFDISK